MELTEDKPAKKRRRWLIGSGALVFVSLCSWWYWPRGDARFVGKWAVLLDDDSTPSSVMNLQRNGLGYYGLTDGSAGLWFSWRISGSALITGSKDDHTFQPAMTWLMKITGRSVKFDVDSQEFTDVTPDRISFRATSPLSKIEFRRIPE